MGLALIKLTQTDYVRKAESTKRAQLLVIPYSHFCDFAVWSLELGKMQFDNNGFAPGQHLLPVLALRKGGKTKYVASSSHVQPVKNPSISIPVTVDDNKAKDEGDGSTSVPVLVLPDGKVLLDSWAIVKESGLPAIDEATKKIYDEQLGPLARQFTYHYLLKPSNSNIWNGMCTEGYSWTWRTVWRLGFGGQVFVGKILFASSFARSQP